MNIAVGWDVTSCSVGDVCHWKALPLCGEPEIKLCKQATFLLFYPDD
jgi:hypothetical protein